RCGESRTPGAESGSGKRTGRKVGTAPRPDSTDEAQHHGDTAHALFDLSIHADQDPGRAVQRFTTAIAGHSDEYARSRGISNTKLASLVMAKGDPMQAVAVGHQALDDVGRLTSRRAADDLRELRSFAGRHRGLEQAAVLRRRITATLQA
ncbi:hypothetical protein ABZ698_30885, partial [Streptomyces antibioticus]